VFGWQGARSPSAPPILHFSVFSFVPFTGELGSIERRSVGSAPLVASLHLSTFTTPYQISLSHKWCPRWSIISSHLDGLVVWSRYGDLGFTTTRESGRPSAWVKVGLSHWCTLVHSASGVGQVSVSVSISGCLSVGESTWVSVRG